MGILVVPYASAKEKASRYTESQKSTLTEEAMERFEEDIKAGKEVNASDYLEKTTNYNNIFSSLGLRMSSLIEKGFNKAMTGLFKELSKAVNNK